MDEFLADESGSSWTRARPAIARVIGIEQLRRCIDSEGLARWSLVRRAVAEAALGSGWDDVNCLTSSMEWAGAPGRSIDYQNDLRLNPTAKPIQEGDTKLLDSLVESINGELQALAGARCFELYGALERYLADEGYFRCPLGVRTKGQRPRSLLYSDYIVWGGWEVSLELAAAEFPELAALDERLLQVKHDGLHAIASFIASLPD